MRGLLVLVSLFIATYCRNTFERDQVLRITANDHVQISLLKTLSDQHHLNLDFWKEPVHESLPVDVHVPFHSLQTFKDFLKRNKIHYEIMIKDLQDLLEEEQRVMRSRAVQPRSTNDYDYANYHTLNEIYSFMDMLVKENPKLVSKVEIGKSYEGQPLYVLKFSIRDRRRNHSAVWIGTGIHAREWATEASGTWFAKKIITDYKLDPVLKAILNELDIFLEIVVNPDGYVYTHSSKNEARFWRKNRRPLNGTKCIGVDLNRNWDANFGGNGSSGDPCEENYRGPTAHSEPEVKAIVDFVRYHGKIKAFVSIHSYSQLLLYPYGYNKTPCNDDAELSKLAKKAVSDLACLYRTQYKYGRVFNTMKQLSGISIDWSYNQGIKYSYAFELRDTGQYGFLLPADLIIPTAKETWLALRTIMEHTKDNPY